MRKILRLVLSGFMLFALASCEKESIPEDKPPVSVEIENKLSPREYFRDTITIYIPGESTPQFLELDLNRRELKDQTGFQHYIFLDYNNGTETFSDTLNLVAKDHKPQEGGFLMEWSNEPYEDLSSRETYDFSVMIQGEEYQVNLTDLQADFLTKNTPEYTRYTSAGKATVTKNGVTSPAYAVLEKAYSSDDSLYVYFQGYDELKSQTHSMHLWDDSGNYYYVDKTNVISEQESYKSHTWLLKKDLESKITQKSFSAEIEFLEPEKKWKINMPDFGVKFELTTKAEFLSNPASGPVSGTFINDKGETKKVEGWFSYYGL